MSSSEAVRWVVRWKSEMSAKALRPGIWRLRTGGFFLRIRVTDPRTGREVERTKTLRDPTATLADAQKAQDQLRLEGREDVQGNKRQRTRWCDYALTLFESKVAENRLKSAASQARWVDTLKILVPVFGKYYVDELRYADVVAWRDQLARWMRDGMPSRRKKDEGKNKLVSLAPRTANGWMSILKVICAQMKKHFELDKDPCEALENFPVPRAYAREQPNACTARQAQEFLAMMKKLHPEHYAMTFLGFVIGARPSTLRPLRRSGPEADILWDEGVVLLRRSNSRGKHIMDSTKTALDQEIPLPKEALDVLRAHVASLPVGPMRDSKLLFPSIIGGMRSRSVLDKPFRDVANALGWTLHLTPRGMRRTFQDLAREAAVHDVVTRAISGHATERMQQHYSTAQREEMRAAVGRVISMATVRERRVRGARRAR
jgi:hypothetical protein